MNHKIKFLLLLIYSFVLFQCNTLEKDIRAINERNAQIAIEPRGDFFIGRRYHVPATRFWGYLRQPGQTWRSAQLVIMDEHAVRVPDRLPEYIDDNGYTFDQNYEYRIYGKYTGKFAYEPNSNMRLPVFKPTRFELMNKKPGWLFKPSEEYSDTSVSLRPVIMPDPSQLNVTD